ncbi:hypothetical protein IL099_002958 [Enterococcus hirae]|nr:hypothetical protein [Enterococcus hirae]
MIGLVVLLLIFFGICIPLCLKFVLDFLPDLFLSGMIAGVCYIATVFAFISVFSLKIFIIAVVAVLIWLLLSYGIVFVFDNLGFDDTFGKVIVVVLGVFEITYLLFQ